MNMKWLGALLIFAGCSGVGIYMAIQYCKEVRELKQLIGALDFMSSELQYRLTPLPDLCHSVSKECAGKLRTFFATLSEELDKQIKPEIKSCVRSAIQKADQFSVNMKDLLLQLGSSLGRFDLSGQIQAIDSVRQESRKLLQQMEEGKLTRVRSYQTLGICAGAAIVVILI